MNQAEPFKTTEVGEIPESWEVAQLGDVFDVQQGKALSPSARKGLSPRPFLRTANVMWGRLNLTTVDQMDFSNDEANRLSLKPGDLLVCEGGEIGRTALWNGSIDNCLYQNHIHRLRARKSDISPNFVMYWMQAAFLHLRLYGGVGNKTTIPNLSGARLKSLPIPLPTFREQRAITSVLSKIQAAVEVQDKIVNTLKELKAATMAKLFREGLRGEPLKQTEIGEIPESWKLVPIGEIMTTIYRYPTYYNIEYVEEGIPEVRGELLKPNGTIETLREQLRFISPATANRFPKTRLEPGDLILSVRGTMGKVGIVPPSLAGAVITANLIRLAPDRSKADPQYLRWVFLTRDFLSRLDAASPQTTIKTITAPVLKSLTIPMPSLDEQKEVVARLSLIDSRLSQAEIRFNVLNHLFSSMLHLLMTGQVRLNDLKLDEVRYG